MAEPEPEDPFPPAVTIRDVARLAGVSVATVSRVFSRKDPVREETRRRILAVAAELRYSPHGAARSLTTERTETIGVLLPEIHGEFFSELIRGIDRAARRRGYHVLVSSSHSERSEVEAVLRTIRGRVDGLILMSPDLDAEALVAHLPPRLPTICLNCRGSALLPAISIDNYGGATAMVGHLAGRGYRRIALLGGPRRNFDARERRRGYRAALQSAGLANEPELELRGDFSEGSGYRAGQRLARLAELPDAVFAANDTMAIGCLAALREAGLAVPGRIAVAGFDDIPIARFTSPPLSTVRVPIDALGNRAFDRLLQAMTSRTAPTDSPPDSETLATELVIRESCGSALSQTAPTVLKGRKVS
jgi:LacI family transcriptional regulator